MRQTVTRQTDSQHRHIRTIHNYVCAECKTSESIKTKHWTALSKRARTPEFGERRIKINAGCDHPYTQRTVIPFRGIGIVNTGMI